MDKRCDVCKQYSQGMTAIDPSVNLTCEHTSDLGLRGIKMPPVGCPSCAERDKSIEAWKTQFQIVSKDQAKHWLYTFAGQILSAIIQSEFYSLNRTDTEKIACSKAEQLLAELEKREADNVKKV